MSTAGKRRAAGPAVTTGRVTGGARKATARETTARTAREPSNPTPVDRTPGSPVPTSPVPTNPAPASPAAVTSRAERTTSPTGEAETLKREWAAPSRPAAGRTVRGATWVRPDQQVAVRDAVEALGEAFDETQWSFEQSNLLVTLAHRLAPTGRHDRLVISNECYTAWVGDGQDPVEVAGALFRAAPLARKQITWILDDALRYGVGEWLLRPVGVRGWVASRRTRTRQTRHFVVAANGTYTQVSSSDAAVVLAALDSLAGA